MQSEVSGSWRADETILAVLTVVAEYAEVVVVVVMLTVAVVGAEEGCVKQVWTALSAVVEVGLVLQGLKVWTS